MKLVAVPGSSLYGSVSLPGDKSISHRAALFAALSAGESQIKNFLVAGVTNVMLQALGDLGVPWALVDTTLKVQGGGFQRKHLPTEPVMLDCGNSGTTMRLLAGALSALGLPAILDGSAGLRSRPMKRIVEPLQAMGVSIKSSPGDTAPLNLAGRASNRKLLPLDCSLSVASAQVKSCLLLAALEADGTTTLREPGPSRDHTERMLRAMGVEITKETVSIPGNQSFQYETRLTPPNLVGLIPLSLDIPGDISSAAFLMVAALITPGSNITLRGVGLNPTRTGLLEVLQSMGADIQISNLTESNGEPVGDLLVRYGSLRGAQISGPLVVRMIDEFPVFAVAAANAQGQSVVSQAAELRHKESDRISDLCAELLRLGVDVKEKADGFTINGGESLKGGEVNSHRDHRLAMALAIAGLAARNPVVIQQAEIIAESYPQFDTSLRELGADIQFI
jgi:3-phosphoshikimate 1-carboxyvinyltransferase